MIAACYASAIARGNTQIIAITGDAAPDGNGYFSSLSNQIPPALNDSGQVAFFGILSGTSGGTADKIGAELCAPGVIPVGITAVLVAHPSLQPCDSIRFSSPGERLILDESKK